MRTSEDAPSSGDTRSLALKNTTEVPRVSPTRQLGLFAFAVVLVVAGAFNPPRMSWDWIYLASVAGAIYLLYVVAAPGRALGAVGAVRRALNAEQPRGWARLSSQWIRGLALTGLLLIVIPEFVLRAKSYHRTLYYERRGDLLFTPIPNQEYMEKVSMTPSQINGHGLRGRELESGKRLILCLGDSITYGYGLSDAQTFPARLDAAIKQRSNEFEVANGGVNAYPMALMWQRFLHLWDQGLRPEAVVLGYSFNEGWVGHLVGADDATKAAFERRVHLKNLLRTSAIYNLVMENWARTYYDAIKTKLVPGTHQIEADPATSDDSYEQGLDRFVEDLRKRGVKPYFVVLCAFNGKNNRFDSDGPLHNRFAAFAEAHGVPYVRSDEVLRRGLSADADLWPFFLDYAHMSPAGADALAGGLADWILEELEDGPELTSADGSTMAYKVKGR